MDIIESKLHKKKELKPTLREHPKNICKIYFHNKGVEMINLPRILKDERVIHTIPNFVNWVSPLITYTLRDSLSKKIFNFNKFVRSVNVDEFVRDETILPCECHDSPFKDNHHQHIVTGDLNIIHNTKLRKLIAKGPKYRVPQRINFDIAGDKIMDGMKECVINWFNKFGVTPTSMLPFLQQILSR